MRELLERDPQQYIDDLPTTQTLRDELARTLRRASLLKTLIRVAKDRDQLAMSCEGSVGVNDV